MGAPELKSSSPLDLESAINAALDEHRYAVRAYVVNGEERTIPFILGLVYQMLGAVNYPLPTPSVAATAVHRLIMARVDGPMANTAILRRSAPRATPEMLDELRQIKSKFVVAYEADLKADAPKLEALAQAWEGVRPGLTPKRSLVYDFFSLPWVRRIEMVKKLGLLNDGETAPDQPQDFKLCFDRVKTDEDWTKLREAIAEASKALHRD